VPNSYKHYANGSDSFTETGTKTCFGFDKKIALWSSVSAEEKWEKYSYHADWCSGWRVPASWLHPFLNHYHTSTSRCQHSRLFLNHYHTSNSGCQHHCIVLSWTTTTLVLLGASILPSSWTTTTLVLLGASVLSRTTTTLVLLVPASSPLLEPLPH